MPGLDSKLTDWALRRVALDSRQVLLQKSGRGIEMPGLASRLVVGSNDVLTIHRSNANRWQLVDDPIPQRYKLSTYQSELI